jgi:hypothetical protein
MKHLFSRNHLTSKRDRRSRTASLRRSRRALALESLEGRALLSVSNPNITSITSSADIDGNGTNEHVSVVAGSTVVVNFDYTTSDGLGNTNQHAEIWNNTFTGQPLVTGLEKVLDDADGPHSGTVTVDTTGLAPGTYGVRVLVNHQGNAKNDDANAVTIIPATITVTPTVTLNAPNAVYDGAAYNNASASSSPDVNGFGATSIRYYATSTNATADTNAISAPTNVGTYYARAFYVSDGLNHGGTIYQNASSSVVSFQITKADAVIDVVGYTGVYDGNAHGATGSATGVKGEALSGLDLGASFTNVPGGTAHWTFTDATGDYNDASGDVDIVISKANAKFNVVGYTGTYDGTAHGLTGTATGVSGEDLSGLLNLGSAYTNVGTYNVGWSFAGNQNYNSASGTGTVTITARSLDTSTTASMQAALDLAKQGTVSFALSVNANGIVDGQTVAQLFNNATFTLSMAGKSATYSAQATVVGNVVYVNVNLKDNQKFYDFLAQGLDSGETSASTANWESISLTASSIGGNYTISEEVFTRIFKTK